MKRPSWIPLALRWGLLVGGVAGGVLGYVLRMDNQGNEPTANLIFWCAGIGAALFGALFWAIARLIRPLHEAVVVMIDGSRLHSKTDDDSAEVERYDS